VALDSRIKTVMLLVIGCTVGTVAFSVFHQDPTPPPPPKPVTKIEIKEVPGPVTTITKYKSLPECADLIDDSLAVQKAVDNYEKQVGELPGQVDDAGKAIYLKDQNKLNSIREQNSELQANSIQALMDLQELQHKMKSDGPKCQTAIKAQ
jgi:hypothetical protein